jgi:hypothetical protein
VTGEAGRLWGWVIFVAGCGYQGWAFFDHEPVLFLFGLAHVIGGTSLIVSNRQPR